MEPTWNPLYALLRKLGSVVTRTFILKEENMKLKPYPGCLLLAALLALVLAACAQVDRPELSREDVAPHVEFTVNPAAKTAEITGFKGWGISEGAFARARPGEEEFLYLDTDFAIADAQYEFLDERSLRITLSLRNIRSDVAFVQPLVLASSLYQNVSPDFDGALTYFVPDVRSEDLGGDDALAPQEVSAPLVFEVIHEGAPFALAVDLNATVQELTD